MKKLSHRLVIIVGTSPQVVTETLWALESSLKLPRGFCSLDLITTSIGYEASKNSLLGQAGAIDRYSSIWGSSFRSGSMELDVRCHVARSKDGSQIRDIATAWDAECMGEEIFRVVRELCNEVDSEVHASIAGGYKTMSFYLGLAMCMYARPQDKLYHTLVPSEYVNRSDWYFPRIEEQSPIQCPSLTFPRLRGFLERKNADFHKTFPSLHSVVEVANQQLGPTLPDQFTLVYSESKCTVTIEEDQICEVPIRPHLASVLRICSFFTSEYTPKAAFTELLGEQLAKHQLPYQTWRSYLSMLNHILEANFGARARIQGDGRGRYRLSQGMTIQFEA